MSTDVLNLFVQGLQGLGRHYRDTMQESIAGANLEPPVWNVLFAAYSTAPKATTVGRLASLFPFTAEELLEQRLQTVVENGYLVAADDGSYVLTEQGRKVALRPIKDAHKVLGDLNPLADDDMVRLAELLNKLVALAVDAAEPREKPHLLRSRVVDPGEGAPAATRIDQYLTDLYFFRDDVHTAAWRPYEVLGVAWEIFTFLWREEARDLDELCERLEARGQSRAAIEAALDDLVVRGWIQTRDGSYKVTEKGLALRQEAEQTTDRLYYGPWFSLSDSERTQMQELLVTFNEALAPEAVEPEAA